MCEPQGLCGRYVPGLSELLHTSCSTMATTSTRRRFSHISDSQRGTMRRQRASLRAWSASRSAKGVLSYSLALLLFIEAKRCGRSVVRACVKAVASSVFYHLGLLVGYARARQPAWLPRWCRRCLWNRSEEIINGLTVHSLSALSVGIVGP